MTEYTADDFLHADFAMHPVTGSVACKGRMDWKWILPGWYDTGDARRLSDQRMADAGWAPVRMPAGSYTRTDEPNGTPDCAAEQLVHGGSLYVCTREEGHDGPHIAATVVLNNSVGAVWGGETAALTDQRRPLTADDISDEMIERARNAPSFDGRLSPTPRLVREMLAAALTEPTRPEGAEKVEAVLHQYWSGDINGDDLADRIVEEMNR